MMYKEIFLMNHVYVVHPHKRVPTKLCPRDEVAHPAKLLEAVLRPSRAWRELHIYNSTLYHMRVEYNKRFDTDLVSSHLYVLVDNESMPMFADARLIPRDDEREMLQFLRKYGETIFAVTSPVFRVETDETDVYYSIPVHVFHVPMYPTPGNQLELRDMIHLRCYTLCNGLTLLLAMVRMRHLKAGAAMRAIRTWYITRGYETFHSAMSPVWQNMCVSHHIPMIADFPSYYATMHPPLPPMFYSLLDTKNDIPLSQWVDENDPEDDVCLYASPITAMFPYLHKPVMDYYNPCDFAFSGNSVMFQPPFEIEPQDEQLIDVEGLFIGVLRSRHGWRWWKTNGVSYLKSAFDVNKRSFGFIMYCFQILFHMYHTPYYGIRYTRSKVRTIWRLILREFNMSPSNMRLFINIVVVRSIVYRAFGSNRWHPVFPISFLVDVMDFYRDRISWFSKHRSRVYTSNSYNPDEVVALFSPYMEFRSVGDNDYILDCSLYQLLRMDNIGAIFVRKVIDKRVAKKLLCVQELFGLKKERPLVDLPEQEAYVVGTVLMDYLQNHRDSIM
jgi:hypothetical protein